MNEVACMVSFPPAIRVSRKGPSIITTCGAAACSHGDRGARAELLTALLLWGPWAPGTVALLLCVPRAAQPCLSKVLIYRVPVAVILQVPPLSPLVPRVAAEAALLLRSAARVFSITSGHLSHSVCPGWLGQT